MKRVKNLLILLFLSAFIIFSFGACTDDNDRDNGNSVTVGNLTFTEISNKASYSVKAADRNAISGDLVIPSTYNGKPVTSVGYESFHNCTQLTSVTIPDSVTFLGAEAFAGCTSLISLEIGNSVPTVSSSFINRCSSLHSLVLPSSVTKIGEYAFNNCSLRTLVIPNSVKSIGRNAFNACNELTTISFMGTRAEWDAISKSSAAIPDSVVVECLDMDL